MSEYGDYSTQESGSGEYGSVDEGGYQEQVYETYEQVADAVEGTIDGAVEWVSEQATEFHEWVSDASQQQADKAEDTYYDTEQFVEENPDLLQN